MKIEIDKSIDANFVYEVSIEYQYDKGKKLTFETTFNIHQSEVSIQRGIKRYKLENVAKATVTAIQQLSVVNFKK